MLWLERIGWNRCPLAFQSYGHADTWFVWDQVRFSTAPLQSYGRNGTYVNAFTARWTVIKARSVLVPSLTVLLLFVSTSSQRRLQPNQPLLVGIHFSLSSQSSGAVWKSRWPSWAPVPNKPTVSVDVKQHFIIFLLYTFVGPICLVLCASGPPYV